MIITYGTDTLDTDTIESLDQALDFIKNIKGQDKMLHPIRNNKAGKGELLFDECTSQEIAITNLLSALQKAYTKKEQTLFPTNLVRLISYADSCGLKNKVDIPSLDVEEYAELQKLSYLKALFTQHLNFLVQSGVGFGLTLTIDDAGKIYCLKDLRDLYTRANAL